MPGSLHILVTSFLYVCLLTHFARQDEQNGNLKDKQNTKKRSYENDMTQTLCSLSVCTKKDN